MKPLPAQKAHPDKPNNEAIPSLPSALPSSSGPYSKANSRRPSACPLQRAYPWMLAASTAVAAVFCLMYINKPLITQGPAPADSASPKPALALNKTPTSGDSLIPTAKSLPGDQNNSKKSGKSVLALPGPRTAPSFEETNLRIQHVLTAESPDGPLARIDIDVPVLYQSRGMRWTPDEVAHARDLMMKLMIYQEKSRSLRDEGLTLLGAWNDLVNHSIPTTALRADSPSLPTNQEWAADAPLSNTLDTGNSIQIKSEGK